MRFFNIAFILFGSFYLSGQMVQEDQTLYGHEWMEDEKEYHKFSISEDGIYTISYSSLLALNIDPAVNGKQFFIINKGKEVPIFVSSENALNTSDYILFYGEKNRGDLDAFLYTNPEKEQLNQEYSLFTDDNAYYLSWDDEGDHIRITEKEMAYDPNDLPPIERFYEHTEKVVFDDFHFKPTHNGRDFIRFSSFDEGEGYGSPVRQNTTVTIHLDHIYTQGTRPKVSARFSGNASNHFIETKIGDLILNKFTKNGYGVNDFEFTFNMDHLSEEVNIDFVGKRSINDRHSLAQVKLTYPRTFHFKNATYFSFQLGKSFIPRYLEIEDFNHRAGSSSPVLIDVENYELFRTIVDDNKVKAVLPFSVNDRRLVLFNENSELHPITHFEAVKKNINTNSLGNYLIITNSDLNKNTQVVREYATYRSSTQGGLYDVSILDIDDITEQYAYGIEGHSIGIKNFINHLINEGHEVKSVFIIGKAIEYPLLRKKGEINDQVKCFVPTYGSPGGDNLFSAVGNGVVPEIPIGRLAAQSEEDVKNYLQKVIAYEAPINYGEEQDVLWRKKLIHLSGGSADIQDLLYDYLNEMKDVIESNTFGGEVTTFRKKTADLLQSSLTDQIIEKIDNGVSMITFFGHAAVGSFDFSLEDPSRYSNAGQTPIILSLGCHSGNVHTEAFGLSEDFVLEPQKGAVAFIASSGTAYINPQFHSGMNFYHLMGDVNGSKSLGELLMKSIQDISSTDFIDNITLAQQLTLHGDPVLKIYNSEGPDYISDYESFAVAPGVVNTTLDSFDFEFQIINRGSYRVEDLEVRIQHIGSDGTVHYDEIITIPAPAFSRDYKVVIPNPGVESVGKNDVILSIDPNNISTEYPIEIGESNNDPINPNGGDNSYSFFILDNKAKPIYPQNFGIHTEEVIRVHATSDNGLVRLTNYVLQIDTTESFDSPLLTEESMSSSNSVITWEPEIEHLDGEVYYWRLSPNNLENEERKWNGSSFIFSPGDNEGWNQSHYYQWTKNHYDRMLIDSSSRDLEFTKRTWDIRVKNELLDPQDFWVFINGNPWGSLNPKQLAPAMNVFIWHPKDILFKNRNGDFGSIKYSPDAFLYRMTNPLDRKNLANLLYGAPEGSRVFMHTVLRDENSDFNVDSWANDKSRVGVDLFDVMKEFGAEKFELLKERGTVPYTFIFDKGVGPVAEDIATNIYQTIDLSSIGRTFFEVGSMDAPTIGPVKRFMRLEWKEEKSITDNTTLYLIGVHKSGKLDTLREIKNDYDVNLTFIHPNEYPQIKLMYEAQDEFDKSAAQLINWKVYFQDLPDVSFDIEEVLSSIPDTLESGTPFTLNYGVRNLSGQDIDSFRVKYIITNQKNEEYILYSDRLSLDGNELDFLSFEMEEILPQGEYKLTVQLNDEETPVERTFDNNIGVIQFFIKGDKREPLLNVLANGEEIFQNQQLSSSSEFEVSFRTPSVKTLISNAEIFEIILTYPNGKQERIEDFRFTPSENIDDNTVFIQFLPLLDQTGKYNLTIKVSDGQKAFKDQEYTIDFYVSERSLISKTAIYPNPMSDYAQINVELDGGDLPANFKIIVFDAAGRIVDEVARSEFQNIPTGPRTRSHLWINDHKEERLLTNSHYIFSINGLKSDEDVDNVHKVIVIK